MLLNVSMILTERGAGNTNPAAGLPADSKRA